MALNLALKTVNNVFALEVLIVDLDYVDYNALYDYLLFLGLGWAMQLFVEDSTEKKR